MPDTTVQGTVPLDPEAAFDVYVKQINTWWPRQGAFPYSFAPRSTRPRHIRFEPEAGGRFYETFADDTEFIIGHITDWQPGALVAYTWRDPTWNDETRVRVRFEASGDGTEVTQEQEGFAAAGVPHLIPYYQIGNRQTLAGFFAHCAALYELEEKGLDPN